MDSSHEKRQKTPFQRHLLSWRCLLLIAIGIAMFAGVAVGVVVRIFALKDPYPLPDNLHHGWLPLDVFIRIASLVVLPAMAADVIAGLGNLPYKNSWRLAVGTCVLITVTSLLALGQGYLFAFTARPGKDFKSRTELTRAMEECNQPVLRQTDMTSTWTFELPLSILHQIFPDPDFLSSPASIPNTSGQENMTTQEWFILDPVPSMQIIVACVVSIIIGFGMSDLGTISASKYLINGASLILRNSTKMLIWCYPVYIMLLCFLLPVWLHRPQCLILPPFRLLFLGLALMPLGHAFIVLPILYFVTTRRNPFALFGKSVTTLFAAFATNNSLLAYPILTETLYKHTVSSTSAGYACVMALVFQRGGRIIWNVILLQLLLDLQDVQVTVETVCFLGVVAVTLSFLCSSIDRYILFIALWSHMNHAKFNQLNFLLLLEITLGRIKTLTDVWGACITAAVASHYNPMTPRHQPSTVNNPDPSKDVTEGNPGPTPIPVEPFPDDPVLIRYSRLNSKRGKDWTVKLFNEKGEKIMVSQV